MIEYDRPTALAKCKPGEHSTLKLYQAGILVGEICVKCGRTFRYSIDTAVPDDVNHRLRCPRKDPRF